MLFFGDQRDRQSTHFPPVCRDIRGGDAACGHARAGLGAGAVRFPVRQCAPLRAVIGAAGHSYADPSDPQRADPGERSAYVGGPSVAYCVRTCDGHFFPIQQNATASPAEICQSLCPAAQTKIFTGSGIGGAHSQDGRRYADLPNAFAYRDKMVSNCSCNGKTPFGLVTIDVKRDPTLRQGDIVATHDGLAQVRGGRRGAARVHADQQIRADGGQAVVRIESRPARAGAPSTDQVFRRPTTSCAIDNALVSPGDSIPNRCTSPAMPCCAGPSIMKSAAGCPGPVSFGRMPE